MKLNSFFDKIFVVNLERRPDRLTKIREISNQIGFEFEVFTAYDGRKMDLNFVYNQQKIEVHRNQHYLNGLDNYSKGCIGCLLSHLDILKKAKDQNYDKILILEDDVEFASNFNQKFQSFISSFDKNWDMIYFSGSLVDTLDKYDYYSKLKSCYTTHSYAVNKSAYDILINSIESSIFNTPIDVTYSNLQSKLECYITMPFLTSQSDGFSDIQNHQVSYELTKKYL